MPIIIGGKPESDFTNPIGMLGDCHRRIVRFLHVLVQLAAQKQDGPLTSEEGTLLSTSLRYFREAAPKHTADEEESLFPRLRRLDTADVDPCSRGSSHSSRTTSAQIAYTSKSTGSVDRGSLTGSFRIRTPRNFRSLADQLERLYRHHIGVEDNEVFPFAARVLAPEEQQAIGNEMAARRGIGSAVLASPQAEIAKAR
jgi:hemerythrin-like domain-containing protein